MQEKTLQQSYYGVKGSVLARLRPSACKEETITRILGKVCHKEQGQWLLTQCPLQFWCVTHVMDLKNSKMRSWDNPTLVSSWPLFYSKRCPKLLHQCIAGPVNYVSILTQWTLTAFKHHSENIFPTKRAESEWYWLKEHSFWFWFLFFSNLTVPVLLYFWLWHSYMNISEESILLSLPPASLPSLFPQGLAEFCNWRHDVCSLPGSQNWNVSVDKRHKHLLHSAPERIAQPAEKG